MSYPNGLRRLPRPFVISSGRPPSPPLTPAQCAGTRESLLGFFGFLTASPCPSRARLAHINGSCRMHCLERLRSDPRIGAANSKVLGLPALNHAFEPSLFEPKSSVAGKRNFQGRDRGAETASKGQGRRCRDKIELKNGANSGLVSEN